MDLALSVDSRVDPQSEIPTDSLITAWENKLELTFDPDPETAADDEPYSITLERFATVEIITEIVDELIVEKTLTESGDR